MTLMSSDAAPYASVQQLDQVAHGHNPTQARS